MSDIKLRAARQLIAEEQTAAARRILETMPSNETARGWLARLNEMAADDQEPAAIPGGAWEYLEVFVKASERQQADARVVLAGQTFTTVEHFYTRKLNELGAQGWELLSEELQGGDFYRLLFKRRIRGGRD
ncbi:MAG: hypothetical protein OXF44_09895 [Anaerolineaceae bacterium]|nr:hypothetical protein [Anaerolineaceae bacterium]MCY4022635.1 hypothetical protein [Anaerolineaceae bacterium]